MTLLLHEVLVDWDLEMFISTWRTTAANETITLPLSGGAGSAYNAVVDWGDGTTSVITSAADPDRIHTYATPGDYKVTISGTLTGWAFNNAGDRTKIRSIDNWGILRFTPAQVGHFNGCSNLQLVATDTPVLSASTDSMFRSCTALVGNSSMNSWNMSGVTNARFMFAAAPAFNSNISGWNTSTILNMSNMFNGAAAFNQPIGTWNTSAVTNMSGMFGGATAFNQPIGTWNTAAVTNMSSMFQAAAAFNQPIGTWNTAAVTNMTQVFLNATSFNQPLGTWNTAAVTTMNAMFQNCSVFNQNLNTWNTAAVTTMGNMFNGCSVYNQPMSNWNTAAVTTMQSMFQFASSFNQDISSWDTRNVTIMQSMFLNAGAFNCGQPAGVVHTLMQRTAIGGWRTQGITSANLTSMFQGAASFAGDISNWCMDAALTLPPTFAGGANANFIVARQPTWGACPIPD